jgi:hypothetical protein
MERGMNHGHQPRPKEEELIRLVRVLLERLDRLLRTTRHGRAQHAMVQIPRGALAGWAAELRVAATAAGRALAAVLILHEWQLHGAARQVGRMLKLLRQRRARSHARVAEQRVLQRVWQRKRDERLLFEDRLSASDGV